MTLRTKALIAVAVALVGSAALIYGVSHRILVHEILAIESERMAKNVSVVKNAIGRELAELSDWASYYAASEDTYAFMAAPSQEYIDGILRSDLFDSFAVNVLSIVRPDGTVAYERSFDPRSGSRSDLPAGLQGLWSSGGPLSATGPGEPLSGLVNTREGTLLLASWPIVPADGRGPPRGTFITGRFITASLIDSLSEQTQLRVTLEAVGGPTLSPDTEAALRSLTGPDSYVTNPLDGGTVAGYGLLNDLYDEPALVLKVESPRITFQQGTRAVGHYVLVVLGIVLAIGVVLHLSLDVWVLAPLRRMVDQVKDLAARKTHGGRLRPAKGEEFRALGEEINNLLDELSRAQQELSTLYGLAREQAERDVLTGLLSRRSVFERLETAFAGARARQGKLALMMIDVDGFKLFNDTHGHLAGDTLLRALGRTLAERTREGDFVGRYGGDEFLVVLPNDDADGAVAQAERLLHAVNELEWPGPDGVAVPISLSIGVSAFPRHSHNLEELIAFADANLYGAKKSGGHAVISAVQSGEDGGESYGFGMLDGLITAVDEKDHYIRRHSEAVASHAVRIAEALGLPGNTIRAIRIAGLLHDVGKTGIPASLLLRPGSLTAQEQGLVRRHVEIGVALINDVPEVEDVLSAVWTHHERVDGTGYPRGLKGEEIPLAGRILAVADTFSAMTSNHPYRRPKNADDAQKELQQVAGSQLDPRVVEVFLSLLTSSSDPLLEERCPPDLAARTSYSVPDAGMV